jgi:hypothetical protein
VILTGRDADGVSAAVEELRGDGLDVVARSWTSRQRLPFSPALLVSSSKAGASKSP